MSAKDRFHDAVKQALLKEQWMITADPLTLKIEGVKFAIDLAAERILAAEKDGQKIAVEIKSFAGNSAIADFHLALGQFLNYRLALQMREPDRTLYLAIFSFTLRYVCRFLSRAICTRSSQALSTETCCLRS